METLDLIIYGSAACFCAVVFLLLHDGNSRKKLKRRMETVSQGSSAALDDHELSLSRVRDTSLGEFGSIGERLSSRLAVAGLNISALQYILFCIGLAFGVFIAVLVFFGKSAVLGALFGFIIGAGIPHFYVGWMMKRRQQQFLRLFPDALELIVRGLRAGLPVGEAMVNISEEIPDPVGPVFREISGQLALGVTFEKAMSDMARRLQLTEFNFFVISVVLQRETGGNLGEILGNLAEVLRERHIMQLKIKAMSAEAKASALIVGSLPFLVLLAIYIISPKYLTPLFNDVRGNLAGIGAICSLAFGMFIMSRLSKFEI